MVALDRARQIEVAAAATDQGAAHPRHQEAMQRPARGQLRSRSRLQRAFRSHPRPSVSPISEDYGATFAPGRLYRYRLWRIWNPALPRALFILMNPSTADEVRNDPTIERCYRRVMAWRRRGLLFGGIEVCNVFAWRETDSRLLPRLIAAGLDIVGPDNDFHIESAARAADLIVCGWGQPGNLLGRGRRVLELLEGRELHALAINADGTPQHPLYIGYDAELLPLPHG